MLFMQVAAKASHELVGRHAPSVVQGIVVEPEIVHRVADGGVDGSLRLAEHPRVGLLSLGSDTHRPQHVQTALQPGKAGASVGNRGIPIGNEASLDRIDAKAVHSEIPHVMPRTPAM